MDDPFGRAIKDYYETGKADDIVVDSNYTEDERIPVSHLFRSLKDMPAIEQEALNLCYGRVLDVGAAAGCHSIHLQEKGLETTALEISPLAVEVMRMRGIKRVVCEDIYSFRSGKFDTIMLLMNGAGIGQTLSGLEKLFLHLKELVSEDGQILIDSTDISYLFEEEDGSRWVDINNSNYFGEMNYELNYRGSRSLFNWLFVEFDLLRQIAGKAGFRATRVAEGESFDYLARLIPK